MSQLERKKLFLEQLARFLVDNQAGKSIALEMEQKLRVPADPRPKFAAEWAKLRSVSPLQGYPTYNEALKTLTEFLK